MSRPQNANSTGPPSGPLGPRPPGARARLFTLARLLRHVGKLFDDQVRGRLDGLGLHPSQGHVLHLLAGRDGVSQRELTRMMRIAAPTVSGILTRMQAAGLIERRPDAADERVTRVHLTAEGRRMGRAARAAVDGIERMLVAGLSPRQLRLGHALLRKLRGNLGGRPPDHEPPVSRLLP